jgi:hypothetical protein
MACPGVSLISCLLVVLILRIVRHGLIVVEFLAPAPIETAHHLPIKSLAFGMEIDTAM